MGGCLHYQWEEEARGLRVLMCLQFGLGSCIAKPALACCMRAGHFWTLWIMADWLDSPSGCCFGLIGNTYVSYIWCIFLYSIRSVLTERRYQATILGAFHHGAGSLLHTTTNRTRILFLLGRHGVVYPLKHFPPS
jgi:hypothetical protein